ncbi:MAG: hypothetical protein ACREOH_07480 [Candidatus Entotheonellia bacterium]
MDTNVFIASMRYVGLRRKLIWKRLDEDGVVVVTDCMVEELRENFAELSQPEAAQTALDLLLQFLGTGQLAVKTSEHSAAFVAEASILIAAKDAPILATAMLPDIEYVVTRATRAFLNNPTLRATRWMGKIKSPQEPLTILGERSESAP